MKETWLCATDLSPASDAAAKEAARIASALGGSLVLLHAYAMEHVPEDEQTGERMLQQERELRGMLQQQVAKLQIDHPQLEISVDVTAGDPVKTILDEAARHSASRLVVGTHARVGVAHLLLGSVAERIVREAKVPVLVVKSGPRP